MTLSWVFITILYYRAHKSNRITRLYILCCVAGVSVVYVSVTTFMQPCQQNVNKKVSLDMCYVNLAGKLMNTALMPVEGVIEVYVSVVSCYKLLPEVIL